MLDLRWPGTGHLKVPLKNRLNELTAQGSMQALARMIWPMRHPGCTSRFCAPTLVIN